MSINIERAAMKAQLAEFEAEKKRLIVRAETLSSEIRRELNTALIPVEDCEIAKVDQLVDDLLGIHAQIAALTGKIFRINRELR